MDSALQERKDYDLSMFRVFGDQEVMNYVEQLMTSVTGRVQQYESRVKESIDFTPFVSILAGLKLPSSSTFTVCISDEMREALQDGTGHLGKSSLEAGHFTGNVHDEQGRIIGQVTLKQNTPRELVTEYAKSVLNLCSQMAIMSQLDAIKERVDDIYRVQKINIEGEVLGSLRHYMREWNAQSQVDKDAILLSISKAIMKQRGLVIALGEKLKDTPNSSMGLFWYTFCHPQKAWRGITSYVDTVYNELVGEMYKLIAFEAIDTLIRADLGQFTENNRPMPQPWYFSPELDDNIVSRLSFIRQRSPERLMKIKAGFELRNQQLLNLEEKSIEIEFSAEEIACLTQKNIENEQ